jgi:hypothetical protein
MAQAIPYIVMAVGTYADMQSQNNAAKERRTLLNQSMEDTQRSQEKTSQKVLNEAGQFAGDTRAQAMQAQEDAAYGQSQKDLAGSGGAGAGIIDTAGDAGNVSGDFMRAKADRALSEGNRLSAIARELAKTRAPGGLMMEEGLRRANLQGDLNSMWGQTGRMGQARQLDAQNVSPAWWGTAGKIASALAGAYLGAGAVAGGAGAAGGSAAGTLGAADSAASGFAFQGIAPESVNLVNAGGTMSTSVPNAARWAGGIRF